MKQPYLAKLRFLLFLLFGLAASLGTAWAQAGTGTVTGRVTDTKNEGIPGVTVVVEGTTLGSSTDVEGNYSIGNVPAGPHTVVISFVGYTTVRQPVTVATGKTSAVATQQLAENATALGEAVVVGYGTQRKQDVTGSLTTVSDKDFVKGQITTPTQLVQGKIAGVQITDGGGAPGAATTIRIRGGSSLNANNDPLIVIDGVPVDNPPTTGVGALAGVANPLSLINPNDIESFTVLKDASATAIYGSRASNGVILITTKKGLSGEALTVNLSSQTSISRRYNALPVLSADEFRTQVQRLAPTKTNLLGTANTNWQDEIFRTAATYDNNVSITGSLGKKVPYRVSYGNLIQQGILITNKLVRNSGSISLTPVILDDHLRINLNVKGSVSDNNFADNGAIGAAAAFNPTLPVYSGNAAYGGYYEYLQTPSNPNSAPQQNVPANPVAQLMLTRDRSTVLRSIGNVQLDYKVHFLPDLHANLNVGYDVLRSEGAKNQSVQLASTYFNTPRVADPATANARGGSYTLYKQNRDNKLLEFYLNYSKQIGDHRIEALAGYSYQDFVTTSPAYASYLGQDGNYDASGLPRLIERTAAARNPYDTRYRIYSFYGRLNYNFKDRYLLTGTLRNDNSSRFPGQHPLFPAASIAWRVKGEDFLKDNTTVSDLKLRVSYGRTGQQDVFGVAGDYPTIPRYTLNAPNAQYQLGGIPYQPYSPLGYNSSLRWETTDTYNAGVDLGFLDGRITASVDAYYRKTVDLLNGIFLPGLTNFTNYYVFNVGSLENRGVEVNVNINPVRTTDFRWDINLNGTYNKNKITSLGPQQEGFVGIETNGISGGTGTNIGIFSVGQASSAFYAAKQVYDANGKPLDGVFADLNGDGKIDATDRYIYKQSAPPVILGFSSNMSYKKLSLAFTLRSNIGNYVYNNIQSGNGTYYGILGSTSFLSNITSDALFTEIPNANAANHYSSDYYIQNASFLRMQNATLGYNVGKIFRDRGNLNLSLAVQNVFVITKYTGLDPEISNGVDNNTYPRPRVFTFGLNLNI